MRNAGPEYEKWKEMHSTVPGDIKHSKNFEYESASDLQFEDICSSPEELEIFTIANPEYANWGKLTLSKCLEQNPKSEKSSTLSEGEQLVILESHSHFSTCAEAEKIIPGPLTTISFDEKVKPNGISNKLKIYQWVSNIYGTSNESTKNEPNKIASDLTVSNEHEDETEEFFDCL